MTKGYPRTRFEIIDQTAIQEIEQQAVPSPIPMAMAAYTSDKGPEEWRLLKGLTEFCRETGDISFVKHGQAQLTVTEVLRAGGVVLGKRMVSDDATLANTTIRAKVVKSGDVSYLYFYGTSSDTAKTFDQACEDGYDNFDASAQTGDEIDVPLFTVTAMGRGVSNLYFRINPEYTSSRSSVFIKYSFEVYEKNELLESIIFTMNPDVVIDGVCQAMNPKVKALSSQVKVHLNEDALLCLMQKLAETTLALDNSGDAMPYTTLINMDWVNALNIRGNTAIPGLVTAADETDENDLWVSNMPSDITDDNRIDLCSSVGISLPNGTYGTLGASPMENATEYEKLLLGAFGADSTSGQYDTIIYDLDAYKIDFLCDCAYPENVKNAIIDLVDFRGDFAYLADLGLNVYNYDDIVYEADKMINSRLTAVYHNHFKIYDPYTNKQIHVTMPLLLASRMVNHIKDGVGRPFAGILHGITFPEIIEGTINYIPQVIPGLDQRQMLVDENINYLAYYNGTPVMETMYTNTEEYTQLSYLHNIMAIQEVIKAVREECPKTRYTFLDGSDLQNYLDNANAVINRYATNFKEIYMTYMADEKYEKNNIFYATITVRFKNFIQEEFFRVIAIS